jgi:ABC-type iron transport system FetAB permease component
MPDQPSITKPAEIQRAVNLLWISFAIGTVRALLLWSTDVGITPPALILLFLLLIFSFALQLFFLRRISQGKNWARLLYLVVFLLGAATWFSKLSPEFVQHPGAALLDVVGGGLEIIAYFLLFTGRGNEWFRTQPVTPPDPQITQYHANMQ